MTHPGRGYAGRPAPPPPKDWARITCALSGANDHPETQTFRNRVNNEILPLIADAGYVKQLHSLTNERQSYCNWRRVHSSIGNRAPWNFIQSLKTDR